MITCIWIPLPPSLLLAFDSPVKPEKTDKRNVSKITLISMSREQDHVDFDVNSRTCLGILCNTLSKVVSHSFGHPSTGRKNY